MVQVALLCRRQCHYDMLLLLIGLPRVYFMASRASPPPGRYSRSIIIAPIIGFGDPAARRFLLNLTGSSHFLVLECGIQQGTAELPLIDGSAVATQQLRPKT